MIEEQLRRYLPVFNDKNEVEDFYSGIEEIVKTGKLAADNFYEVYGTAKEPVLDQGDCIKDMPIFNLPHPQYKAGDGFILSNVCDVSEGNVRTDGVRILYAPVLNFEKYIESLKERGLYNRDKEQAIRQQKVTNVVFLPKHGNLGSDSFVPLDQICSIPREMLRTNEILERRIFQLSRVAWYLLLMKITHHFARVNNELFDNRSPAKNP